jgi:uncharacterized protein
MKERIMKRKLLAVLALTGLMLFWCAGAALSLEPIKITKYVTDQAGLLSQTEGERISGLLFDYARKTGNQLLIVTVPGLEGEAITDYAERLFELNRPGEKGKDNGIIMLIARDERKIRLEVGYGLEAVVPDGKAGTIIRDDMTPRFKEGDYYSGIVSGITAIITAVSPDYKFSSGGPAVREQKRDSSFPSALIVALIIFFITAFGNMRERQNHRYRRSRGFSEPWYWGGGGGGGFGGGSDGGFSGGGGGFGGGGASGSW